MNVTQMKKNEAEDKTATFRYLSLSGFANFTDCREQKATTTQFTKQQVYESPSVNRMRLFALAPVTIYLSCFKINVSAQAKLFLLI